ncbi:hypothetical protein CPB85DRAFT_1498560 [Mucidula mucida]|nr:hypothetical protein CPB85DRAFT_1498560 [Mucidula mucida]
MPYSGKIFKGTSSGDIVEGIFQRDSLRDGEVLIMHVLPTGCALGHEGAGYVEEIGPSCKTDWKVGERVGWGYIHHTCGKCRQIPDGLSNENAAPLMCGTCKPTNRIGIVGIGGLGHLTIQFAAKMGCDIVVFSETESKRQEAIAMGARVEDFNTLGLPKPLDTLIVTTATLPDWDNYFKLLSVNCTIIPLTGSEDLTLHGYTVVGTILAGRSMHEAMLAFAARNQVNPIIEKFPLTKAGVEEAVERLQSGRMRYRGALTNEQ